ncbi:MAG: protein kinase [Lachnospiraceae bacterium]|nr:protein kinase [Lachnospiraceae bacterium]
MKLCYSCFSEFEEAYNVCPYCGTPYNSEPEEPIYLAPGTVLNKRYIVGEAIKAGGFGIVYKAFDTKLEVVVAIKEFYSSKLMTRAKGDKSVIVSKKTSDEFEYRKKRFLVEAKTMARFGSHRSIVNVYEFFEENNTAYFVMEYLDGEDLSEYLKHHGGRVPTDFALMVTNEIGYALKSLHECGVIHRDVAPDNIYICHGKNIKIKLLDLGAALIPESDDEVLDLIMKVGYSPCEQYDKDNRNIGPWTDVYALGATLYKMLTGIKELPESTNRKVGDTLVPPAQLNPSIDGNLSNSIMKAMAVDKYMRFKNVNEFLRAVNGEKKVSTLGQERLRRKIKRAAGIAAAGILILIGGIVLFKKNEAKKTEKYLESAEISLWYCLEDGSKENEAIQDIVEQFIATDGNEKVKIEVKSFSPQEYESAISKAASDGKLPNIFESTELSDDVLEKARKVDKIFDSPQAKECMFINQYDKYYKNHKQVPMGIVVPVAYVITKGAESVEYSENYFSTIEDFKISENKIALDQDYSKLVLKNFNKWSWADSKDFLDNGSNKAAVMISSTMKLDEVKSTLTSYQKKYVYPNNKSIYCEFTYEWSLGEGSKAQERAADRFVEWMLGTPYQNALMVSRAQDGQIPVNKKAYMNKCEITGLDPLRDEKIAAKFVFEESK